MNSVWRGYSTWRGSKIWPARGEVRESPGSQNDLRKFFEAREEGPGIWKWRHYFDIYNRHFSRFRGTEVHILEIGIYSGGSLEMWRDYFGPAARIYGVDINPACQAYESESVKVLIGDQADRNFWKRFKAEAPRVDIVVDDGGHQAEQQIATFEELFPYMQPGGVYLCEDMHGAFNRFAGYMHGFANNLNAHEGATQDLENNERRLACRATDLQSAVRSVHFYPFVAVVEKMDKPIYELVAPKHGTQWTPFLK
jgi:23S rRNA U2552 (ribose-2'-O)-methylase RlmE/FtsJ